MYEFKIADETDAEAVGMLFGMLFEEVGHTPDADEIAEIFAEIDADDHCSTVLAFDEDGELAGAISLAETISIYAGGKIGVINELFVMPEHRSEGLGKQLLEQAKSLAEERGWKRLEVTAPGDEYERTLRFYEREGFFKIGPRYKFEV